MQRLDVDSLTFEFPAGWLVTKFDDWEFYRHQFSCMWNGIKSVDVIAVDSDKTAWFIEAKDYRRQRRTKALDLGDEIAQKVFASLAALLPAKVNPQYEGEAAMAATILGAQRLRVVLHLEQPTKTSRLFPRAINPNLVRTKLRHLLKPIDPHAMVVEISRMDSLSWSVQ